MREIGMGRLVSMSVDRMILILFKRFSLKKWLLLLLIAYLAGALGGGGSSGGRGGGQQPAQKTDNAVIAERVEDSARIQSAVPARDFSPMDNPKLLFFIGVPAVIIISLIMAIMVLFSWLSSRFKFIWYESIVKDDASIINPFDKYEREGSSLFSFFMISTVIFFGILGAAIAKAAFAAKDAGLFQRAEPPSLAEAMNLFGVEIFVVAGTVVVFMLIGMFVDNFIVTIMALERSRFLEATKKFIFVLRSNVKDFFIYILVLVGLGIISGAMVLVAAIACIIMILLAGALLFGIPFLIFVTLLKIKILFAIFAIVVGVPYIIVAILLFSSLGLPVAAFFKCFSLYFLGSLKSGYKPLPMAEGGNNVCG